MKINRYVIGFLLGMMIFVSLSKSVEVMANELPVVTVSCAVPLPPSAPGEEKKDMMTALAGLAILSVIVVGGITYLKKNFSQDEQK